MNILLEEGGLRVSFRVNEDRTVELADFSAAPGSGDMPLLFDQGPAAGFEPRQFLAVHVTGESSTSFHANKHDAGSVSREWRYVGHVIEENADGRRLILSVKAPDGLAADYCMQFYRGLPVVRAWAEIRNESGQDMGIEYVSSFMYAGIGKNRAGTNCDKIEFFIPHNGWSNEAQWERRTAADAGLSHMPSEGYRLPDKGNNRFQYGSVNSWSSSEYLPMGMARDPESGEIHFFEIDHSGAWRIEYGTAEGRNLYVCLLGPDDEANWWVNLRPGERFVTVPVAAGAAMGGIDEAAAALTSYRRRMRKPSADDPACPVVFNDYMNCLSGDPTEEKEYAIIDRAAALGCEYYCIDAGWYDSGSWWDRVGEWKESPERFPSGLRTVMDYGRSKGLKMGLWVEIESMGVACPLAQTLPDDWFVRVHGKRRVESDRYLLDFRNPAVREYCAGVIDRLVADYGCAFFKIDYNVTTGMGCDVGSDSPGQAMLEHYRALYQWIEDIYRRHPGLVIENCGSGGQRMDYGMLARHSLQSTSDQTDVFSNAYIAASVASAVTPEQAGMWVYPYRDEREHVVFNMVNGLLLRPYISGQVWDLSPGSMALLGEGIALYKRIRRDVRTMVPFFPLGFGRVNDAQLAYGLRGEGKAYLSVFCVKGSRVSVPLHALGKIRDIHPIYPVAGDCKYALEDSILQVELPEEGCARLFEIEL